MLNKDIIGLANDKFIKEADPRNVKKKKRKRNFILAAAVAACLLIALNLWLFIPLEGKITYDVSKYKDSEYYEVISSLNGLLNYESPRYSNNFQYVISNSKLLSNLFGDFKKDYIVNSATKGDGNLDFVEEEPSPDEAAPSEPDSPSNESYEEVTDNQVSGVTEMDLFKRSDKYIYYLDSGILRVYSIEGEDSKEAASYGISEKVNNLYCSYGIYLSRDCKTLTVIAFSNSTNLIKIISLDVSDINNIKEKATVEISGDYVSSRIIDGELFVVSAFNVYKGNKFNDPAEYVPSLDTGNGMSCIPPEDIVIPDKVNDTCYTVITRFDENTLEKKDCTAFLSYSSNIYVSNDTIYLTHKYNKSDNASSTYTDIIGVDFSKDHFEKSGSTTIKGFVNNQYNLDEYNGVLRVVTTTNNKEGSNASLYCIGLENWECIASVENFAPYGETVRSVRFDGETAYVCTAVQVTDPVFFFDLSDYSNITYKETDPIDGFSTSLVNFGEGYLLGIGRGNNFYDFKLEIYKEGNNTVESVCKFELVSDSYPSEYKAYYIDRQNQTVGMAVAIWNEETEIHNFQYLLLKFDGEKFTEVINVVLNEYTRYDYTFYGFCDDVRATCIDGYFYIFAPDCFKVEKVDLNSMQ